MDGLNIIKAGIKLELLLLLNFQQLCLFFLQEVLDFLMLVLDLGNDAIKCCIEALVNFRKCLPYYFDFRIFLLSKLIEIVHAP